MKLAGEAATMQQPNPPSVRREAAEACRVRQRRCSWEAGGLGLIKVQTFHFIGGRLDCLYQTRTCRCSGELGECFVFIGARLDCLYQNRTCRCSNKLGECFEVVEREVKCSGHIMAVSPEFLR